MCGFRPLGSAGSSRSLVGSSRFRLPPVAFGGLRFLWRSSRLGTLELIFCLFERLCKWFSPCIDHLKAIFCLLKIIIVVLALFVSIPADYSIPIVSARIPQTASLPTAVFP